MDMCVTMGTETMESYLQAQKSKQSHILWLQLCIPQRFQPYVWRQLLVPLAWEEDLT
jgi:hypothetical protein